MVLTILLVSLVKNVRALSFIPKKRSLDVVAKKGK